MDTARSEVIRDMQQEMSVANEDLIAPKDTSQLLASSSISAANLASPTLALDARGWLDPGLPVYPEKDGLAGVLLMENKRATCIRCSLCCEAHNLSVELKYHPQEIMMRTAIKQYRHTR
ncbi:uncharacterized protein MCYG_07372 [Microsporum canis CBS 113480]|uniref:Uncharacterized protein n=1 Tax=Arthroderma otae (strain ATCC MYA-4605 / CBS 113480) TaxID=554155 RepID=C5FYF5_ARTOC|nr:uncharacterized protein MCYG_07372 [Microsporum canis CBS 113480]EEQ34553.1 predicted protein [Microsporum canis CBS 113480]